MASEETEIAPLSKENNQNRRGQYCDRHYHFGCVCGCCHFLYTDCYWTFTTCRNSSITTTKANEWDKQSGTCIEFHELMQHHYHNHHHLLLLL